MDSWRRHRLFLWSGGTKMIKIWFLLVAQVGYLNAYEAKPRDYKEKLVTDAFCLPFDAFPVQGMNYKDSSFGA